MAHIHLILMPEYGREFLPPLGIASLAAYLKNKGIKVTCTDFRLVVNQDVSLFNDTFGGIAYVDEISVLPLILLLVRNYNNGKPLLTGLGDVLFDYVQYRSLNIHLLKNQIESTYRILIRESQLMNRDDIFGFSVISSNIFYTVMLSLILRLRNQNVKIIYGGPQVTLSMRTAKLVLKLLIADIVILGDGEDALFKIINSYNKGSFPKINGTITYNKQNATFLIKPPKVLQNLNTLPDPDFSVFRIEQYQPLTLPIYASKGCIHKCYFCSYNKQVGIHRLRTPKKVVDTMERMHRKYNTIRFQFADSSLNLEPKWIEQFADELIKRKCNFLWEGFFKPYVTKELVSKLKKAGLLEATIGVESFSDRVLKKMGRGFILSEDIVKTIGFLCSADITIHIGIIIGFPGESKRDFLYTLKQLLKLQKAYPRNIILAPQRFQIRVGSRCLEQYDKFTLNIKNWGLKESNIIPEIRELVRETPMVYFSKKPSNREIEYRAALMNNMLSVHQYLSADEKLYLRVCLRRIKRDSIVYIKGGYRGFVSYVGKNTKMYFSPAVNLVVNEKEMTAMKFCDGRHTVKDIIDKLSCVYKEDKNSSFRLIVHLLHYLIDHNIQLTISRLG